MTSPVLEPRSPVSGWGSGGGGGVPDPHGSTHEPGGTDVLTAFVLNTARGAPSGVGSLTSAGRQPTGEAPLVSNPIRLGNVSSTVTSDAGSGAGNLINLNVNGNITIVAPINPTDHQVLEHHCVAVGADRQVTFTGTAYVLAGAATLGPYLIPRGKVLVARSVYLGNRATAADAAAPAWGLMSATVSDAPPAATSPAVLALPEQAALPAAVADTEQLFSLDVNGITSLRAQSPTGLVTDIQRDNSVIARNETGATIAKGSIVYLAGASTSTHGLPPTRLPLVALARADAVATMPAIGVALQDIVSNAAGRVLRQGMLIGIDTSTYTAGARLWVSTTVAGGWTTAEPTTRVQRMGIVVRAAVDGQILVGNHPMFTASEGTLTPAGGVAGAVLTKTSATDWATEWRAPAAVPNAPRTQAATTTASIDTTVPGDVQITCTGDTVMTPSGTPNGRTITIEALASGAQRVPSVATSVALTTGITSRSLTVPSGKIGVFVLRYSGLPTAPTWYLASAFLVG